MKIQDLLTAWRQAYSEWVSLELQLRTVRNEKNSGPMAPLLEERIRLLKQRCSEYQDAATHAIAAGNTTAPHAVHDTPRRERIGS